jgi:hypothetical protein
MKVAVTASPCHAESMTWPGGLALAEVLGSSPAGCCMAGAVVTRDGHPIGRI